MRYLLMSILLFVALPAHAQPISEKPDTAKFNSVCRVDSSIAWAVADSGRIYRQTTAGWSRVAVDGIKDYKLKGISVLKERPEYVWVVGVNESTGKNILLKTNCGRSEKPRWKMISDWPFTDRVEFTAIEFADPFRGYIYGSEGLLLQSHDGGETWVRVPGGQKP